MNSQKFKERSQWVRGQVLEMIVSAGKGHIGGSLSCTDILVFLYSGNTLRIDPNNPNWDDRDRFIYSKGHASEALYAVLADVGFFDREQLKTYGLPGSVLGGHADKEVPGIEISTGSLGHGLGVGAGMAMAAKLDQKDFITCVLMGDGECYEGSVWETAMFAAHHQLYNLVAIVDRNRQITLDYTEDCNELEPFLDKWEAFGWETKIVDGHNFDELFSTWKDLRDRKSGKPTVIIANTTKGKGISFMEGDLHWHHNVPRGEQVAEARRELGLRS